MKPLKKGDPVAIGGIRLQGRLGEGGMGTVYFGLTPAGDRLAVKTIRVELLANDEAKHRFDREIDVLGMVVGPRVAGLVQASEPDEEPRWFATEYIQGLTLAEYVAERGLLPAPMAVALGLTLADALSGIHHVNLLHRDLKPGNVILGQDGPRVIDFGLAGLADQLGVLTQTGVTLGTPLCMPPEQVESPKTVTAAADVYALGVVLVFALTGDYPYGHIAPHALLHAVADPGIAPNLAGVPAELKPLIASLLAHDPAGRPTLPEFIIDLNLWLNDAGISPSEAQHELATLTYLERESDPPPPPPVPGPHRRRLPGIPHVPAELVRQIAEGMRREYARGAVL